MGLAQSIARQGLFVTVYGVEDLEILRSTLVPRRLPGIDLDGRILLTNDINVAMLNSRYILICVPSDMMRRVASTLAQCSVLQSAVVVSCTKGIETDTLLRMSQVLAEVLPRERFDAILSLSGPSFALEVARGLPTTAVVAGPAGPAFEVQNLLMSESFRIYTSTDLVGVELGGALKNVLAIAAGMSDGLGFGHNAKAALITRGLAEMTRVGVRMGAEAVTFAGLSGLGDLVVTCTGELSRNRALGERLGRGMTLEDALLDIGMTVEGVSTARSVVELQRKYNVDMPICDQVAKVLFEGKSPAQAVRDLMLREPKPEVERAIDHGDT